MCGLCRVALRLSGDWAVRSMRCSAVQKAFGGSSQIIAGRLRAAGWANAACIPPLSRNAVLRLFGAGSQINAGCIRAAASKINASMHPPLMGPEAEGAAAAVQGPCATCSRATQRLRRMLPHNPAAAQQQMQGQVRRGAARSFVSKQCDLQYPHVDICAACAHAAVGP